MAALPIKIYIRTRPTTDFAGDNIKILDDRQTITVNIDKSDPLNFLNTPECNYTFKFHSILHNVSQEIVFEESAREIVDSFIQGYNGCLFSFGQRNSGKTFTMFGGIRHFKYRGIIPRTLAYIFQELEKYKTIQFTLSLQYFQIYNDIIYDLLSNDEKEMQIAEDEEGNPFVQNLSSHVVEDATTALQHLINGDSKLHLSEHKNGRKVYRSHAVFGLDLIGRKGTKMTHSKLLMLDLAATEEAGDAAYVNQSIAYLQQLVVSIIGKENKNEKTKPKHLPFRRSKLTYLLRDAIGGNCRTAAIATIWPEKQNNRETISTFQFAFDLGKVRNDAKVNTMEPPELRIEKLEAEMQTLEAENELQAELGGAVKIDGLKQEDEQQVADLVALFLSDEIDTIPLPSVAHIKAIFAEIKRRYTDIPNQVMREVSQNFNLTERVKNAKAPKDVGTIDGSGFSIGVAASQDRPCNIRTNMKANRIGQSAAGRADNPPPPTEEQMFEIYKLRDGKAAAQELVQAKKETKDLKETKKGLIRDLNTVRAEIKKLEDEINSRGLKFKEQIDEEEADLIKSVMAAKRKNKEKYAALQKIQAEIDAMKEKTAGIRSNLLEVFSDWYKKWQNNELYTEKVFPPHDGADLNTSGKDPTGKGKKKEPARNMKGKAPIRGRK